MLAQTWGARGGGAAPPSTLLLSGGSAPLAAAAVHFFATDPLVWGSCAAWGKTCFPETSNVFGRSHLSGAASLPGADVYQKFDFPEEGSCQWGIWGHCKVFAQYKDNHWVAKQRCGTPIKRVQSTEGNDCKEFVVKVSKKKKSNLYKKTAQTIWAQALFVSAEKTVLIAM